MKHQRIYLDYAASTPLDSEVEKAMRPYYARVFGNPSSSHLHGQEASRAVFLARQEIARTLNADYSEIVFTGSATEANNLGIYGVFDYVFRKQNISAPAAEISSPSSERCPDSDRVVQARFGLRDVPKNAIEDPLRMISGDQAGAPRGCSPEHASSAPLRVVVSAIEHESVYEACMELKRKYGAEIVEIPVNGEGIISIKKLKEALNENTVLVSVQMANSEIGVIQPIAEITKIIRDFRGANPYPLFHTDAVQAFQYMQCDMRELGVDMLTLSAHKIYGPKGIGCLFVRNLEPSAYCLAPIVVGGGQENGLRSGTENVPAIVGFAKAVGIAEKMRVKESKRVTALRDALWKGIKKIIPDAELNGHETMRTPNNLNVYLLARSAQDACIELDLMGVAVSPGTACASRAAEPSRVIKALRKTGDRATSSIRLSLGRQTTMAKIRSVLAVFKKRFRK